GRAPRPCNGISPPVLYLFGRPWTHCFSREAWKAQVPVWRGSWAEDLPGARSRAQRVLVSTRESSRRNDREIEECPRAAGEQRRSNPRREGCGRHSRVRRSFSASRPLTHPGDGDGLRSRAHLILGAGKPCP